MMNTKVRFGTKTGALGTVYKNGDTIVRQGETGDCMYVIQSGELEVVHTTSSGEEQQLAVLGVGDFFGEMAVFEKAVRSATVRVIEEAQVLKVDKLTLLRRIKENPLMAFNMLKVLASRIRDVDTKLATNNTQNAAAA